MRGRARTGPANDEGATDRKARGGPRPAPAACGAGLGRQRSRCHGARGPQAHPGEIPASRSGRGGLALIVAAAAILLAAAVFGPRFVATSAPEPPTPASRSAPASPVATTPAQHDAGSASERSSAVETPPAPPVAAETPARGWRLQLELVDEQGRPFAEGVDVEHRLYFPNVTTPVRVSDSDPRAARGPRVDLPVETHPAVAEGLATQPARARVVVRRLGLHGESDVPIATGAADAWTRVVMRATTVIRGQLVDAQGAPLEGVELLVRDDVPGSEAHTRLRTDASGAFALDALRGRKNRIFVGDAAYPWTPPIDVDASGPDRTLEPIRLELHAASFQVNRADGLPASGARLEGIGLEGGRFAVDVDADGRARVTTLLRGRWRVNASDPTHGRANRAVEVPLENDEPVLLMLRR